LSHRDEFVSGMATTWNVDVSLALGEATLSRI
jgi:hypothetical protein